MQVKIPTHNGKIMNEDKLIRSIEFIDSKLQQNEKAKAEAIDDYCRKQLVLYGQSKLWQDYKKHLESELQAERIVKFCQTGK